jgi:hypothetical protein
MLLFSQIDALQYRTLDEASADQNSEASILFVRTLNCWPKFAERRREMPARQIYHIMASQILSE